MNIVNYDKKTKVLSVSYNTPHVWEYKDVDEISYKQIIESKLPKRELQHLLSTLFIVGINRGVNDEL